MVCAQPQRAPAWTPGGDDQHGPRSGWHRLRSRPRSPSSWPKEAPSVPFAVHAMCRSVRPIRRSYGL